MSLLRKLGEILGSTFFALFLIGVIVSQAFVQLTEYNTLKSIMTNVVLNQIPTEELTGAIALLEERCGQQDSVQFEYGGQNITLDCEKVKNQNVENITTAVITETFNDIYYRKYDCDFINCLRQPGEERLMVLFSVEANSFFRNINMAAWVGAVLSAIMMLVSIPSWEGRLKGIGFSLVFVGLPFVLINYLRGLILPTFSIPLIDITPVIEPVFSSLASSFMIVLVLGIALTAAGYTVQFLRKKTVRQRKTIPVKKK